MIQYTALRSSLKVNVLLAPGFLFGLVPSEVLQEGVALATWWAAELDLESTSGQPWPFLGRKSPWGLWAKRCQAQRGDLHATLRTLCTLRTVCLLILGTRWHQPKHPKHPKPFRDPAAFPFRWGLALSEVRRQQHLMKSLQATAWKRIWSSQDFLSHWDFVLFFYPGAWWPDISIFDSCLDVDVRPVRQSKFIRTVGCHHARYSISLPK